MINVLKDGDYVVTADGKNGILWDMDEEDFVGVLLDMGGYADGETVYYVRPEDVFFVMDGEFSSGDRVQIEDTALQCDDSEPLSDAITGTVIAVYRDKVCVVLDDFNSLEESMESYYYKTDVSKLV